MNKTTLRDLIFTILAVGFVIGGITIGLTKELNKGIDCGIIASKMDILTDNGIGEYKRLSDLYIRKNCPIIEVEKIRAM